MKNVILILGILTTVMVYGVVAGVSTNASPPALDMDLNETQCRICHDGNIQSEHHQFIKIYECSKCHIDEDDYVPRTQSNECGIDGICHNNTPISEPTGPVTDHHNFTAIFEDIDWDCLICHEKGVPRPFDE